METVRPLDVLNNSNGKEITVLLKNNQIFKGKLKAFDIHLNLVLFETFEVTDGENLDVGNMIIRGDAIVTIQNL